MKRHVTPGLIVSIVALVVATAGTAGAAGSLITSAQIKNNSITAADIKNQSLTGADIKNRSISTNDIKLKAISAQAIEPATLQELQETPATATVQTAEAEATSGYASTLTMSCPDGQVALGGGASFVHKAITGWMQASEPVFDESSKPVGWRVVIRRNLGITDPAPDKPNTVRGYAICSP